MINFRIFCLIDHYWLDDYQYRLLQYYQEGKYLEFVNYYSEVDQQKLAKWGGFWSWYFVHLIYVYGVLAYEWSLEQTKSYIVNHPNQIEKFNQILKLHLLEDESRARRRLSHIQFHNYTYDELVVQAEKILTILNS